jgi:hypothetical protein
MCAIKQCAVGFGPLHTFVLAEGKCRQRTNITAHRYRK